MAYALAFLMVFSVFAMPPVAVTGGDLSTVEFLLDAEGLVAEPRLDVSSPPALGISADFAAVVPFTGERQSGVIRSISAGGGHSVAILNDGSLWGWGDNWYGQLGLGAGNMQSSHIPPTQIGDASWSSVSAGHYHAVGIQADGSLWAWGRNTSGQLGDNSFTLRRTPVRIGRDYDWSSVSAGDIHTLAIRTDGSLWAYGRSHNVRHDENPLVREASDEVSRWLCFCYCVDWKLLAYTKTRRAAKQSKLIVCAGVCCECDVQGNLAHGLIELYQWFADKCNEFDKRTEVIAA